MDADPLRAIFDRAAETYQPARPGYPAGLFDDLAELTGIGPGARVIEIGCGPGTATVPLAERGYAITAIELGPALAGQARRNLARFDDVEVITTGFEDWHPEPLPQADLVCSATAWHWLDPDVRLAKSAALLRPGGHLAVWSAGHAFPPDVDPFFAEIQQVYDALGEGKPGEWPPTAPADVPGIEAEVNGSALFELVGVRRQVWAQTYDADGYLALLDTFSGHLAMAPATRDHLYAEIRRLLARRPDGRLVRHWIAVLTVARSRSAQT